jgi:hypothetical protein
VIGSLEAELALWDLAGKSAVIEKAIADDVVVTIGEAPLVPPDDEPDDDEPGSWSVEIPKLVVKTGRLEMSRSTSSRSRARS